MPEKVGPQWWSPVMPVSFFLSSIAAGTAVVILVEMWIAKGWKRPLRMTQLASLAQFTGWSLFVYLAFRLGDMALRGQLAGAFSGRLGLLFLSEIGLGGVVPLVLLARRDWRLNPALLLTATALTAAGVTFNRINVVLLAMTLRGAMPQIRPELYTPSLVEWGISIGLIAATIFLFGLAARLVPLLPADDPRQVAHG
jgi:formate dehydrogenase iron-sulfur subunit